MRARRVVGAALGVALAASILTSANAEVRPIIIGDDHGGGVDTFSMWYRRLAASGVPVRIRGVCVSACTLVFMLPKSQVCIEPTASLGFHLASMGGESDIPYTQAMIRRWYPEAVRRWLVGKTLADRVIYMSAQEVVKLDVLPACATPAGTIID